MARLGRSKNAKLNQIKDQKVAFSLEMALALHRYGLPTHRLEATMSLLNQRLHGGSQFFSSPSNIIATFGEGHQQQTYMLRTSGEDLNLAKLNDLYDLAQKVAQDGLSPGRDRAAIKAIVAAPVVYPQWLMLICLALSSSGAARLFGGGWREMLVGGFIAILVGLLTVLGERLPALSRILLPFAAFSAIVAAKTFVLILGPFSVYISTVTGLIILIPGLTLTIAVIELATGHPVSGTSRFATACVTFLMLLFGIAMGDHISDYWAGSAAHGSPHALADWTMWPALAVVPFAFVVIFKASPRDTPWVVLAGIFAFLSARFGTHILGPQLGTFVASFLLAIASSLYGRTLGRITSVPLVPGLMLLVPGSLGFKSLSSLLEKQTILGLETGFNMIFIAVALVAGLIFANFFLPPRNAV